MVIERLVWRAKFGQGDQVADAFKQWRAQMAPRFGITARIMVDLTGPMFTVVVETEYRDMAHVAEMAAQLQAMYGDPEFQQWFGSWQGAVESGTRELYQVVE
jgi:hypothetical protein